MNSGLSTRLAKIENSRRVVLVPLVVFFRAADSLSFEQKRKINKAKQSGRRVKLIKTFVA